MPAEIVRIDFFVSESGTVVQKFDARWIERNGQGLISSEDHPSGSFDLESALAWLDEHGWKIRRWPCGARAWKYEIRPIRTKGRILQLRAELRERPRPELEGKAHTLDLAYDL